MARMSSLQYRDDFLGAGSAVIPAAGSAESGVDWVKKIVGAAPPTVGALANAVGGQIELAPHERLAEAGRRPLLGRRQVDRHYQGRGG
jgi:hypothetical protein